MALIVGASFAGLAVARRLAGRVLLLDRNEVGAVQTSACGTPLWVPQALGVADIVREHRACLAWGGTAELSPADDIMISVERPLSLAPKSATARSPAAALKS